MKLNRNFSLFFALYTLTFAGDVLLKNLLEYDRLVYETYFEQVALDQINDFIVRKNLFDIISYIVMPLFLFVKIYLISTFLDIGFFLQV